MERREDKFLLGLVEQDHLDGSYIFAVGWNGHILVISALDGDRFISWLKMGLQFGLPPVHLIYLLAASAAAR